MIEEQGEWLAFYRFKQRDDPVDETHTGAHHGFYPEPHKRIAEFFDNSWARDPGSHWVYTYFEIVWTDDWEEELKAIIKGAEES